MTYETIERDPVLGARLWRVSDCTACNGTGKDWHPGCGDAAATCRTCDGDGQVAKFKWLDINNKPYGAWHGGGAA
jgi:DnaJ-class molecular chaperone